VIRIFTGVIAGEAGAFVNGKSSVLPDAPKFDFGPQGGYKIRQRRVVEQEDSVFERHDGYAQKTSDIERDGQHPNG
jgi:hypothetical protein